MMMINIDIHIFLISLPLPLRTSTDTVPDGVEFAIVYMRESFTMVYIALPHFVKVSSTEHPKVKITNFTLIIMNQRQFIKMNSWY